MIFSVITLATSKGGVGKSTLVRSLAGHWFNSGLRPAIVDADPQGSIINRHDPTGPLAKLVVVSDPEESVASTIEELKGKHKLVLVDTGGFRNRTTIMALINSDLAIIPLKPSADDMAVAIETYQLIKELNETPERAGNPIKIRMIITMTQQGTVISRHVRSELEEVGLPIMKAEMYQRVAYPESGIRGLSPAITDPEGAAAQDIAKIAAEIANIKK
jgi:chromosome partitioning protein